MPRQLLRACYALLTASVIAGGVFSGTLRAASPPVPARQLAREFTFIAAGDMLGPYHSNLRLDDPSFAKVVNIVRGADAAFANQEGNTFDLATFTGWAAPDRGTNIVPPHSLATARAFKEMGFELLSRANNHSTDWGAEGLLASDRVLDAIGIVHAGTGRSLTAARAPAYFQSAKGSVALIASASTFEADEPAGNSSRGVGPRPGINPLRLQRVHLVTPQDMSTLRQVTNSETYVGETGKQELFIDDVGYRESDGRGVTYEVNGKDRSAIIDSIAAARRSANFVVYSLHAHQGCPGGIANSDDAQPCDFLIPLFHDILDAGADVVVRSGPHVVQGIEIYHGKAIFYGLGDLFFELPRSWIPPSEGWENGTVNYPAEYYESAIAFSEFRNGFVSKIIIYPLVIDALESSTAFGIPKLAQGADARRILERIQQRSAQLGTKLDIVNDAGIIKGPSIP